MGISLPRFAPKAVPDGQARKEILGSALDIRRGFSAGSSEVVEGA
jgi:hypothetical protein